MSLEPWTALDDFFMEKVGGSDDVLEAALAASRAAGFPPIAVSPPLGKLLHLLARMIGARKILEIGTLGGYSTIWLARALPADGRLVTLEIDPRHAEVARANIARAGLNGVVDLRLGRALDTLPRLEAEGAGPFDLLFFDADKPSNPDYFRWALKLSRPGSVIVVDNVVRKGAVLDAASTDEDVQGVRRMLDLIAAEPRACATVMQTVGSKGHDGIVVALVNA
ncbi:MAG TPA: O-methyltransferase [Pirellulales bacterium]|jgi:predicted O-methyltransferase YrrM|nr:O-methyltransferase [Pirellulales bacterium]